MAYSPSTDLTFSGESVQSNRDSEAMLPAERSMEIAGYYTDDATPADDPRASPIFMQLERPPPTFISVGDGEMLLDDSTKMAAVLKAQGAVVELDIGKNLPHAAPFFALLVPEALAVLRRSIAFLDAHIG